MFQEQRFSRQKKVNSLLTLLINVIIEKAKIGLFI